MNQSDAPQRHEKKKKEEKEPIIWYVMGALSLINHLMMPMNYGMKDGMNRDIRYLSEKEENN